MAPQKATYKAIELMGSMADNAVDEDTGLDLQETLDIMSNAGWVVDQMSTCCMPGAYFCTVIFRQDFRGFRAA